MKYTNEKLSEDNLLELACLFEREHGAKFSLEYFKRKFKTDWTGKSNIGFFAKDIENWVLESIEQTDTFVTEQGDIESWKNNDSDYKKKAVESLQDYLMHIKKHLDQ